MTTDRNPDRIARAWLDLMPSEVPDRVIDAVLQAAETVPQLRKPLVRTSWRPPQMNRMLLIVATAALGVALAGGLLVAGGAFDNRQVPPIATPPASAPAVVASPTSSPAAELDPVPPELVGRWMGSPREGVTVAAGVLLTFDPAEWAMSLSNRNTELLGTGLAGQAASELVLAGGSGDGCLVPGRYRWTVSPSDRALAIDPIEDGCAARASLVTGTYWRSDCRDPGTNCLGDLDAGAYASQYMTPLTSAGGAWSPVYGALTYTVPDGWANWSDWPGRFGLTPSDAYAATTASLVDPARWILVLRDAVPESQATRCSGTPEPGVDRTPGAFLAWLRTVPGLTVGKVHQTSIDGRDGAYADLGVDDATLVPCGGDAVVEYMIADGSPWAIFSGERQRLILLDNGNGGLVAIQISDLTGSEFAGFVDAAMPIVEGLRFQ